MKRKLTTYDLADVEPYINWLYFYHAWGLSGKPEAEKQRIRSEALDLLHQWQGRYHTRAVTVLYDANADGDDLLLFPDSNSQDGMVRIPMLRQQHAVTDKGEPNLCLADYVRPLAKGIRDKVALFCASVDAAPQQIFHGDDYMSMLAQTLCDRLAEATVEKLHVDVRRTWWGYAPDEHLTLQQLFHADYQGIRPAVGYPSLPDVSVNFLIEPLLQMSQIGIRLTQSGMMIPHSSVSGFMFAHPQARYFSLGKIDGEQLADYARRRGIPVTLMKRYLQSSLIKR